MLDNPYQSPLCEGETPRIYTSRLAAARSGALRGGRWAVKWTAIICCGPLLFLPWATAAVIGLYGHSRGRVQADELLSLSLNLIGGLLLFFFWLGTLLLLMAVVGAVVAAIREAARFQRAGDGIHIRT